MFGAVDINLRAERAFAVGELPVPHAREQVEVFLDATIAVRAFLGLTAVFVGFIRGQIADVSFALFNQRNRVFVDLFKIIGSVERFHRFGARSSEFPVRNRSQIKIRFAVARNRVRRFAFWLQAQLVVGPSGDEPVHVLGDGIHVLDVFLRWVGVIHAEVANAAELARDAEVQADAFGVADVEVTIRLRRKTGVNLRIFFLADMFGDDVTNEIRRRRGGGGFVFQGHKIARRLTKA